MNPNTYHWLQSVCLPLTPTKHLNSRDLWWVEGWKLLLPVCLISRALLLSLFNLFSFPLCPVQIYSFALFHLQRKISDRGVIPPVCLAVSLDGLCHWYFLILPSPPPTTYHFCSCWQGAAIYLSVPAREWVMRVSSVVAEGAAEPDVNIRFESSHL